MPVFDPVVFDFLVFDAGTPAPPPIDPESPMAPIDHVEIGLNRLYQEFRKPAIIAILTKWLERYNDLEQVYQDLLRKRNIFNAVDAQEDLLGRVVVQQRNGLDNDTYRRYLFARIAVNNSNGLVEDLIKITALVMNDDNAYIHIDQVGAAAVIVRIENVAVSSVLGGVLIDLLRDAPLSGVRLILQYSQVAPSQTFRYDSGPGYDVGHYESELE